MITGAIIIGLAGILVCFTFWGWGNAVDRDRWRRRAEAESKHLTEVEKAIEKRCAHFQEDNGWCKLCDGMCEARPCFVQDIGYSDKAVRS